MYSITADPTWSVTLPSVDRVPTEDLFQRLAAEDPDRLIDLLKSGRLASHHLTFAAEYSGDSPVRFYPELRVTLTGLLSHKSPAVREGAIYGLAKLMRVLRTARDPIEERANAVNELSPGVRRAALGVLDAVG